MVFQNLDALHFNKEAGTVVDSWANGRKGDTVTTFDAAYTIVALDIYRACARCPACGLRLGLERQAARDTAKASGARSC